MQENNDRQEQKVARRTYMAHALLTALVVNITWLVDVSIRLLVYLDLKTLLPWFKLQYGTDSLQECIRSSGVIIIAVYDTLYGVLPLLV